MVVFHIFYTRYTCQKSLAELVSLAIHHDLPAWLCLKELFSPQYDSFIVMVLDSEETSETC